MTKDNKDAIYKVWLEWYCGEHPSIVNFHDFLTGFFFYSHVSEPALAAEKAVDFYETVVAKWEEEYDKAHDND